MKKILILLLSIISNIQLVNCVDKYEKEQIQSEEERARFKLEKEREKEFLQKVNEFNVLGFHAESLENIQFQEEFDKAKRQKLQELFDKLSYELYVSAFANPDNPDSEIIIRLFSLVTTKSVFTPGPIERVFQSVFLMEKEINYILTGEIPNDLGLKCARSRLENIKYSSKESRSRLQKAIENVIKDSNNVISPF